MIDQWIARHPDWFTELRFDLEEGHVGWNGLIDGALSSVEQVLLGRTGRVRIVQIKDKFGLLTIHSFRDDSLPSDVSDRISEIFQFARDQSAHVCEICGAPARLGAQDLCMSVRCGSCAPMGWKPCR